VLYRDADVHLKREIISAIYPQKLEYDGFQFRTTHLNEVIATIFSLDAAFQKEKSRQNGQFSILSAKEVSSRLPPALRASGDLPLGGGTKECPAKPNGLCPISFICRYVDREQARISYAPNKKAAFQRLCSTFS
jgi:hypothetical protein